ncbi:precorrin-8X methylmutase [Desulfovibrio mangrovi]|nr:precorrin-8X methylmutase [Desulfovibrio mangrovi]UZP69180.1 precorrin-8X methylmutase [Desulfovibrio mangrovi]
MPSVTTLQPYFAPDTIEARSFEIIDSEVPEPRPFTGHLWEIARRLIHTSADFDLLNHLTIHPAAVAAGLAALRSGCTVFTDTEMARSGIPLRRMEPLGCRVQCLLNRPDVVAAAKANGTTRAHAAMDAVRAELGGSIMAIGNAPTALIRLMEHLDAGGEAPALVIGMPVGFVNAAESKELLVGQSVVPFIAIRGRKGGSPLAAATVNALAEIALRG